MCRDLLFLRRLLCDQFIDVESLNQANSSVLCIVFHLCPRKFLDTNCRENYVDRCSSIFRLFFKIFLCSHRQHPSVFTCPEAKPLQNLIDSNARAFQHFISTDTIFQI